MIREMTVGKKKRIANTPRNCEWTGPHLTDVVEVKRFRRVCLRRRTKKLSSGGRVGCIPRETDNRAAVCCSTWILIMSLMVTGRQSQVERTHGRSRGPTWIFQTERGGSDNHEAGSTRPVTAKEIRSHALLQDSALILLRHRPARKKHVHPHPRPRRQNRLRTRSARRP